MEYKTLIVTREGPIDIITLNRPERMNAFSYEMIDECVDVLHRLSKDWSTWVLVIRAAGKAFCSGHDIAEPLVFPGQSIEEVRQINRTMLGIPLALQKMNKAVISSVQGVALGFGFDLALASDMIISMKDARFSQGFLKIGLAPGMGGAWHLPRIIGMKKAAEVLFTGDFLNAEDAYRLGMINKLVEDEEQLENETMGLARKLGKGAATAIRMSKYLMYNCMQQDFSNALDACNVAETMTLFTDDFVEGEKAIKEKRQPDYKGK